jgi:hypothetical protein
MRIVQELKTRSGLRWSLHTDVIGVGQRVPFGNLAILGGEVAAAVQPVWIEPGNHHHKVLPPICHWTSPSSCPRRFGGLAHVDGRTAPANWYSIMMSESDCTIWKGWGM